MCLNWTDTGVHPRVCGRNVAQRYHWPPSVVVCHRMPREAKRRVLRRIQIGHLIMPKDKDQLLEEAIPLIAEDLRDARVVQGLTFARAAAQARISVSRYRTLESGRVRRSPQNVAAMVSVAERLGLESVRVSYAEFVGQYLRVVVAGNGPLTIFIETLDSSVAQLKEQGHFVSPNRLLDFVDHEGVGSILDSRKRVDKLIVELWITALFTLCLDDDLEYYVSAAMTDAPDTKVLMIDKETNGFKMVRVEITQHGRHSASVTAVIAKKLLKRYQDGTVLVVLVEEAQNLSIVDLYDYVQKNNPHRQEIFIIGGAGEFGKFKVVPWNKVTEPSSGEKAWMEITVDTKDRSKRRCTYDGVVFKPPHTSRPQSVFPVFIKELELHR